VARLASFSRHRPGCNGQTLDRSRQGLTSLDFCAGMIGVATGGIVRFGLELLS